MGLSSKRGAASPLLSGMIRATVAATFAVLFVVGCSDKPTEPVWPDGEPASITGGDYVTTQATQIACDGPPDCAALTVPPGLDPACVVGGTAQCLDGVCVWPLNADPDDCTVTASEVVAFCETVSDCDDGNVCTIDYCNPETGCVNVDFEDGTACNDRLWCTEGETCNAGTCGGGSPRDCTFMGDGSCLVGICHEETNACVADPLPKGSVCDDGVDCTEDACNGYGHCVGMPDNTVCDDGVACTGDTCTPDEGCVYDYDDSACPPLGACLAGFCDVDGCGTAEVVGCCQTVADCDIECEPGFAPECVIGIGDVPTGGGSCACALIYVAEICDDDIDNDGDGYVDCADHGCHDVCLNEANVWFFASPACGEYVTMAYECRNTAEAVTACPEGWDQLRNLALEPDDTLVGPHGEPLLRAYGFLPGDDVRNGYPWFDSHNGMIVTTGTTESCEGAPSTCDTSSVEWDGGGCVPYLFAFRHSSPCFPLEYGAEHYGFDVYCPVAP